MPVTAAPDRERRMFSHQKLKVYAKALGSVTRLARHSALWDNRHAVVDQQGVFLLGRVALMIRGLVSS